MHAFVPVRTQLLLDAFSGFSQHHDDCAFGPSSRKALMMLWYWFMVSTPVSYARLWVPSWQNPCLPDFYTWKPSKLSGRQKVHGKSWWIVSTYRLIAQSSNEAHAIITRPFQAPFMGMLKAERVWKPSTETTSRAHCLSTKALSWNASCENTNAAYGKTVFTFKSSGFHVSGLAGCSACIFLWTAGARLDGCI